MNNVWEKAPTGATHYAITTTLYYKLEKDTLYCYKGREWKISTFNKNKTFIASLISIKTSKPLYVWFGRMPESNGKSNWTVILYNENDLFGGFTVHRSEYPDRARYDADVLRYMLGEIANKPNILDYSSDLISAPFEWKENAK